jgi:hypothetical protein
MSSAWGDQREARGEINVSKVLFVPFGAVAGLLAGFLSRRLFRGMWSLVDYEEAPDPKRRDVDLRKLTFALLVEGAIFRAVRGLLDHGTRRAFSALTGAWPGEQRPQPEP